MDGPISRVLVVYKKSNYTLYGYEQRAAHSAPRHEHHQAILHAMRLSHEENCQTLEAVQEALQALGVPYDCLYRGELREVTGYDLLLSVGGDGTFLEVARYTTDTPILGVNSDPARSTAFFCAANRQTVRAVLDTLLARQLRTVRLARMQVTLNGRLLPYPVLNDLLIADANPAAMTAYTLRLPTASEAQRSSGLWIATAAGSTAAIRAAGGRMLPLRSRKLQYLVREPYVGHGCHYQYVRGTLPPNTALDVLSKMRCGRVFLDGPHLHFAFGFGDVLTVAASAAPVRVLGLDPTRRQRF